jgi:hypothetical protein
MTWARDFVAAKNLLQKLASSLPPEQQAVVANLQTQLDGFIVRAKADLAKQPELGKQAHLAELRRRRDQAAKQGDAASVSRYDNIIETVSAAQ